MTRPAENSHAPNRRLAWASNALLWSFTTRRLLESKRFGETQLALVGFHLCLQLSVWQLDGNNFDVYADPAAREGCPIDPRELRRNRDTLARMRNDVLHFLEGGDGDASITARYSHVAPHLTLAVARSRGGIAEDTVTGDAITGMLDLLDPWFESQIARLRGDLDTSA